MRGQNGDGQSPADLAKSSTVAGWFDVDVIPGNNIDASQEKIGKLLATFAGGRCI